MDPITILRRALEAKVSEVRSEEADDYNDGYADALDYVRELIREED